VAAMLHAPARGATNSMCLGFENGQKNWISYATVARPQWSSAQRDRASVGQATKGILAFIHSSANGGPGVTTSGPEAQLGVCAGLDGRLFFEETSRCRPEEKLVGEGRARVFETRIVGLGPGDDSRSEAGPTGGGFASPAGDCLERSGFEYTRCEGREGTFGAQLIGKYQSSSRTLIEGDGSPRHETSKNESCS